MIYASPEKSFLSVLTNAPAGLVGTVSVRIENPDGTTHTAPTTTGIVEVEPGVYVATRTAPTELGTYVIVWFDGTERVAEELRISYTLPEAGADPLDIPWRPALDVVAAYLRARTKGGSLGQTELGTFTDSTRPTDTEAERVISLGTSRVASKLGTRESLCSDELTSEASDMAALYSAMLIELSYFPEQIKSGQSPYKELKELYDDGVKSLLEAYSENCGVGGDGEAVGGTGTVPRANFGSTRGLIGRRTVL